jgi:HEAT repeat protein
MLVAALSLAGGQRSAAQPFRPDPVNEFRNALRLEIESAFKQPKESETRKNALTFREKNLKAKAANLTSLNDISRALLLQEWQTETGEPDLNKIDLDVRKDLGDRFKAGVRKVFEGGNRTGVIAAANLVGETAVLSRPFAESEPAKPILGSRSQFVSALMSELGEDLIKLTAVDDPGVREAALTALGKLDPTVQHVKVIGKYLTTGPESTRFAAALALHSLIDVILQGARVGFRAEPDPKVIESVVETIKLLPGGLDARQPVAVQRLCSDALRNVAGGLGSLIQQPERTDTYPPADRKEWSKDEIDLVTRDRAGIVKERERLQEILSAFKDVAPRLSAEVADTSLDPVVRQVAERTLQDLAAARQKLLRRERSVPHLPDAKPEKDEGLALVRSLLRGTLGDLTRALQSGRLDFRSRRIILDIFDSLLDDTRPSLDTEVRLLLPTLIAALRDPDHFVRWPAARAIGRIAPDAAAETVPALAARLDDADLDVRLAVVNALNRYGELAKPAVPALAAVAGAEGVINWPQAYATAPGDTGIGRKVIGKGDPDVRVAAIYALESIGTDAVEALPSLERCLGDSSAQIRTAAAEVIGQFGGRVGESTREALRRLAATDPDPEVRRAASAALLRIVEKK